MILLTVKSRGIMNRIIAKLSILFVAIIVSGCCFVKEDVSCDEYEKQIDSLRCEAVNNNGYAIKQLHEYYQSVDKEWEMIAYYMVLSERYSDRASNYAIYDIISRDVKLSQDSRWIDFSIKYLKKGVELNDTNCIKEWQKLKNTYLP